MDFRELFIRLSGLTIVLATAFAVIGLGLSIVVGMIFYPAAVKFSFAGGWIDTAELNAYRDMRLAVILLFALGGILSAQTIVIVRAIERKMLS